MEVGSEEFAAGFRSVENGFVFAAGREAGPPGTFAFGVAAEGDPPVRDDDAGHDCCARCAWGGEVGAGAGWGDSAAGGGGWEGYGSCGLFQRRSGRGRFVLCEASEGGGEFCVAD